MTEAAVPTHRASGVRRAEVGRALVLLALAVETAALLWHVVRRSPLDLRVYLWGGHAVIHDAALYRTPAFGHWQFTYPPFAAVVFAPLSALPSLAVRIGWALTSLVALAYACRAALRLGSFRHGRWVVGAVTALSIALEPMRHTFSLGQVNLVLLALVLCDLDRIARGRRAGIGIGLASAVKLVPGLFIVLLVVTRRGRDAALAVATALSATAVGFAVAPHASIEYWRHEFYDPGRVGAPYISNQSVYGASSRLLTGTSHVLRWWYLPLVVAIAAIGIAVAAAYARRGDWLTAAAATGVTSLLVSPISWTHHWVWVMPALLVLVREGRRRRVAAALGFALFALSPLWWTPHFGGPHEYGWHGPLSLVANCYLLAGAAFLAYVARGARHGPGLGYRRVR